MSGTFAARYSTAGGYVLLRKASASVALLGVLSLAILLVGSGEPGSVGAHAPVRSNIPMGAITPTVTATPCSVSWRVVFSPDGGSTYNYLNDVAAAGIGDVWGVGAYWAGNFDTTIAHTLIEHWDGISWSVVPSPDASATRNELHSIEVVSTNDVWAVGSYLDKINVLQQLIVHWNGVSWSIVTSPTSSAANSLVGIGAVAADDVWAVGNYQYSGGTSQTLVEHWDGVSWSVVSSPNLGSSHNYLESVAVVATDDVWAAGYYIDDNDHYRTLIQHWDGTSWNIVPSLDPSPGQFASLYRLAAVATDDVWAVGSYQNGNLTSTLIEHWDGTSWSTVPSPNPGTIINQLIDVEVVSPIDVWAVGKYGSGEGLLTLVEHWDGTSWSVVPSADAHVSSNELFGVTAIGPNDIWAVGSYEYTTRTLTEHYSNQCSISTPTNTPTQTVTGTPPTSTPTPTLIPLCDMAWQEVSSPNVPDMPDHNLLAVDAASSDDVWAVGYSRDVSSTESLLIEHWNGGEWSIVAAAVLTGDRSLLNGVWAGSASDVWAVGSYEVDDVWQSLTIHWDGAQWSVVPSPNPGGAATLNDVAGISANDVWAVGSTVLHWDGIEWSVVANPAPADLTAISALSANDIWAVGRDSNGPLTQTFTMHWDGSQWSVVPSPNVGDDGNYLYDIEAISANDVWAVGSRGETIPDFSIQNLAMHWDGTQWTVVTTPNFSTWNSLNGLTGFAADDIWAVGWTGFRPGNDTVTLHWNGAEWSRVASPNTDGYCMLNDVVALPNDEVWAVGLAGFSEFDTLALYYSSTSFSDVPQGSTFYPYVNCLACRGVVSGYGDGTFRPGNPVTRGQIAKIVIIATRSLGPEAAADPLGSEQYFQDVPPESTFFEYIQVIGGVVTGYPCGGPGEPCVPPDNLPYFRPGGNASRGQLSKIVSEVAGFTDPIPPGTQTFADVLEGSTFHIFIERLLLNRPGVMEGYPCGGDGEPCDDQNRPYFRPGNTVTRGQAAKIVSNTFFPNCQPPGVP